MITKSNNLVATDLDKVVKHNNETNTTELGGNVEVDGKLTCQGGEEVITSAQAVIDEGNPQLNLKQGDEIVEIVDLNPILDNGEKIDGYSFTSREQENLDYNLDYVSIAKNGKKLTFVVVGRLTKRGDVTGNNFEAGNLIIPSSISPFLIPLTIGSIEKIIIPKQINFYSSYATSVSIDTILFKDSATLLRLQCYNLQRLTLDTEYYFRYEVTFLLSDNLISAN